MTALEAVQSDLDYVKRDLINARYALKLALDHFAEVRGHVPPLTRQALAAQVLGLSKQASGLGALFADLVALVGVSDAPVLPPSHDQ